MPIKLKQEVFENALFEKGFTLNQFALYSKISKAYLSQLKNNKRNPSLKTVEKILDVLKDYERSDLFECVSKQKQLATAS